MARRSQRALRERRGFDSQGRTAYEFGQHSRIPPEEQYARARARGHNPPPPPGPALPVMLFGFFREGPPMFDMRDMVPQPNAIPFGDSYTFRLRFQAGLTEASFAGHETENASALLASGAGMTLTLSVNGTEVGSNLDVATTLQWVREGRNLVLHSVPGIGTLVNSDPPWG